MGLLIKRFSKESLVTAAIDVANSVLLNSIEPNQIAFNPLLRQALILIIFEQRLIGVINLIDKLYDDGLSMGELTLDSGFRKALDIKLGFLLEKVLLKVLFIFFNHNLRS